MISAVMLGIAMQSVATCEASVGKTVKLSDHLAVASAIAAIKPREAFATDAEYKSSYRDALARIGLGHIFGAMTPDTSALPYDADAGHLRVTRDAFDSGKLETAVNTGAGSFLVAPIGFGVYLGQGRGRVVRQEYVLEVAGTGSAGTDLIAVQPHAKQLGTIPAKEGDADKLRDSLRVAYSVELTPPYIDRYTPARLSGDVQCAMLIDSTGKVYFAIRTN